ncbi:MAG: hypothetical protein LBF84_03050 [Holosporales bacterium]|jgi:hypothetical protein|nr:hypothetical protein [Holosporales bacterium]
METSLTLSIGGLPPLSARGCTQELKPKPQGFFKRTLNGDLIFVGNSSHKYISTIKCSDSIPIATEGLQIGTPVLVGCIQPLCQKISISEESSKSVTLERDVIVNSVQIFDAENRDCPDFTVDGRIVTIPNPPQYVGLFVSYYPILNMRVTSFVLTTDEWNMKSGWQLDLEEV